MSSILRFYGCTHNAKCQFLLGSRQDPSITLRLYEIQGVKAETSITLLGQQRDFRQANLLEENLRSRTERVLRVNPYEIKTFKIQVQRQGSQ